MPVIPCLALLSLMSLVCGDSISVTYKDHTFLANRTQVSFPEAFAWCSSRGGHLPSVHSEEDIDFLLDDLKMSGLWLGGREVVSPETKPRTAYQWTDGSVWLVHKEWMGSKANCRSCCGLFLSITRRIVPVTKCDPLIRHQVVCRVPNILNDVHALRSKVHELSDNFSTWTSTDRLVYDKLVNLTLTHSQQLEDMGTVVRGLEVELWDLRSKVQDHRQEHRAVNDTTMTHIGSVNETLHQEILKLRLSLNQSTQSVTQELRQQVRNLHHVNYEARMRSEAGAADIFQDMRREVDRLEREILFLVILVAIVVSVLISVPAYYWMRKRRNLSLSEDQVRLSQINESY